MQKVNDSKSNMKPKIKYDKESNILSIKLNKKRSVDPDVKDNIVIDYDENGEIVNIEIMKINIEEFAKIKKLTLLKELIKV